ncbi:tryptophan synthase subunit alpha [Helicobacter sp. 16-1353]|uniref:tryptophan synthase subunit alpha n=1 Tax=Helicobacter sp. 16-1353 TaxID=2004996 RepID=UPI000DCEE6E6|nr:tryptophan synthase subunit alpha [Helicobacter sp. 16-1353]RAX54943.1 tryptophan synthase subunit alpha [Helicobacter sp. 16-1353]
MKKINLMTHLVAGYPSDELALSAAKALIDGGASILEIQLPFSDPSADGKAIQNACSSVLERGYKTKDALNFIESIHNLYPKIPIFIMSYASLIVTPGIENFIKNAKNVGVSGVIIPDLPFDNDEGLGAICSKYGVLNIPVAAPSMSQSRISKLVSANFPYIYTALRSGITGEKTIISTETLEFIAKIRQNKAKILAGFGISKREQSSLLAPHVYAVVAGSVFVEIIAKNQTNSDNLYNALKNKALELVSAES